MRLAEQSLKFQKPNQPVTGVAPLYFSEDTRSRPNDVIHMKKTESKIRLQIENILLTKKAKNHVLSDRAVHLRPRALVLAQNREELIPRSYPFTEK
jgi:hypothetical protein